MTIFWERCSICDKHRPIKQCWLHPERDVCSYCCIICPERDECPNPVWFTRVQIRVSAKRREEKARALEELLKRLGSS